MHQTEFNRRMSSAITELGKRRGLYEVFLRKLLQTEYCVRMSSVKTVLKETTKKSDFYRELLYHPEIGRRTSSVSIELEKQHVCKRNF